MRNFLTYLSDKVLGCQTKEERHTGHVACKGAWVQNFGRVRQAADGNLS